MLSRNLEQTLHRALALATERRHEYATLSTCCSRWPRIMMPCRC